MAVENNFNALCCQVNQLYTLAKQGKIDWSIVHEATVARDKLHAELANDCCYFTKVAQNKALQPNCYPMTHTNVI